MTTRTAQEILAAWNTARATGGAAFYSTFESLTGFTEADVRAHFKRWGELRHETAEAIAENHGMTLREGGFQAFLADETREHGGLAAALDDGYEDDPNPRQDKPWPEAEDCRGCDRSVSGPHRFGCSIHGAYQARIPVTRADGKFRVGS